MISTLNVVDPMAKNLFFPMFFTQRIEELLGNVLNLH